MPIFGVDKLVLIWNRFITVSKFCYSRQVFLQSKHGIEKFYTGFCFENIF